MQRPLTRIRRSATAWSTCPLESPLISLEDNFAGGGTSSCTWLVTIFGCCLSGGAVTDIRLWDTRGFRAPLANAESGMLPSPFGGQDRQLRCRQISGLISSSHDSGLQPPCLRFAAGVTPGYVRLESLRNTCRLKWWPEQSLASSSVPSLELPGLVPTACSRRVP